MYRCLFKRKKRCLLVSDTSLTGVLDVFDVLVKGAAGSLVWGCNPGGPSCRHLLVGDLDIDGLFVSIDRDNITVLDQTNRASFLSLGRDVTNDESVGSSREATIGQESNVVSESSTHNGRGRGQHLGHTRTSLGARVTDNDDLALLDLAVLQSAQHVRLVVVDVGRSLKEETLLSGDLGDRSEGGKVTLEDAQVTVGLDGLGQGVDDILTLDQTRDVLQVFAHGLSGDGQAVSVDQAFLEEVLQDGGGASDTVDVLHDILSRGLQVGQKGDAGADALEVIDGQLDVHGAGDGNQVEDGVGGASQDHGENHGVLESLAGHNITWFDVILEQITDRHSGIQALLKFLGVLGGSRRTVRKGHSHCLNSRCHY